MPIPVVYATAALLAATLFPVPESYREIMYVAAFGTFSWGAWRNFEPFGPTLLLAAAYGLFALLFNPVRPVLLPDPFDKLLHVTGMLLLLLTVKRISRP
jgi:hypothetical protein